MTALFVMNASQRRSLCISLGLAASAGLALWSWRGPLGLGAEVHAGNVQPPGDASEGSHARGGFSASRESSSPVAAVVKPARQGRRTRDKDQAPPEPDAAHLEQMRSRLQGVLALSDPFDRTRGLIALLDQLQPDEFTSLLEVMWSTGLNLNSEEGRLFMEAWVVADHEAALAYVANVPPMADELIGKWAVNDPDAALAWARSRDERAMQQVLVGLGKLDLNRAMQVVQGLPPGEQPNAIRAISAGIFPRSSNEEMKRWIDSLPGRDQQRSAVEAMMYVSKPGADPIRAEWLQRFPELADKADAVWLYQRMALNEPSTGSAALEALPPGPLRQQALTGMVQGLSIQDPQKGLEFMNRYPSEVSDQVLQGLVTGTVRTNPSLAMTQAARIQDEAKRNEVYRGVMNAWRAGDPQGASEWLQQESVPQSVKDLLGEK